MFLSRASNFILLLLRVCVGWLFIYQGYLAYKTPGWSMSSLLQGSDIAVGFYNTLLQPSFITPLSNIYPFVMMAIGLLIFLGLWMRIGIILGSLIMILLYLPLLHFPAVGTSFWIVDYHIILLLCLLTLWTVHADQFWGLGAQFTLKK